MPSNSQLVGQTWPATSMTFEARVARAYAAATDDHNPRYQGTQAVAPPMAVVVAVIPHGVFPAICDEKLIVDMGRLARLLHAEEDIRWHGVLTPGDTWQVTTQLQSLEEKTSGEILKLHTTVKSSDGVLLAESVSSMFVRERNPNAPKRDEASREPTPQVVPANTVDWTVAPDQSTRYAEASGDHNPIHLDDEAARFGGLKAKILHGLCTMAFAQRAVIDTYADADPAQLERLRVRFARPVYMGDTLSCVCSAAQTQDGRRTVNLMVKNQDNHAVLTHGVAELSA